MPADYRLVQIAANLERSRWVAHNLGQRYIFVDVPVFRVDAYDGGQKTLEMNVIDGQECEGKKTSVFADFDGDHARLVVALLPLSTAARSTSRPRGRGGGDEWPRGRPAPRTGR
ncbi:MAG: hypothetical protein ABS52_11155 [Gemmatimonadetes bacterium SCN 70-22]|nr:MAG: hypothetical protein ABS52_11155 [Gemmatimonadetes bacterium SCN 70-22]